MFEIAGRSSKHAASRGVTQLVNIITNGLLLTPGIVEAMLPLGLTGVKVTLEDKDGVATTEEIDELHESIAMGLYKSGSYER